MKVSASRSRFSNKFGRAVAVAKNKKVNVEFTEDYKSLTAVVSTKHMVVGRFMFEKMISPRNVGEELVMVKHHVIDKGSFPLEACLFELTKYLKKSKIKYISLRSGILKTEL